ncbi:oxidoreductase (plasmid) [Microvirga ossetica]|uniref:Oxidoreductase n=1 Tax=Microvirga ossetica TaxID=1882682 RepID=A0A1B2EXN0_9HYPH|nr:aldo/keto reductase [Microvirga ossetica]ANY84703.1 oxidoreductase [Microvirga ossetica]
MASHTIFDLNDGNKLPRLGFGLWQVPDEQAPDVVHQAIRTGYRLIDTAAGYGNEEGVGEGISAAGVARTDLFVTTKLASQDHGYDEALKAFDKSLGRLGLAYVDLYLIHWPRPWENRYVETWRAFQRIKQEGRARSIGVSNFTQAHIQRLIDETGVVPAVNQIELHPRFQQKDMRQFHDQLGMVTQSWSPLGRGHLQDNETITELASKYGKSWAQIVIRWHLDNNLSVIPKSITLERIRQNFDVFDFQLALEDVARINKLQSDKGRIGAHPDDIRS